LTVTVGFIELKLGLKEAVEGGVVTGATTCQVTVFPGELGMPLSVNGSPKQTLWSGPAFGAGGGTTVIVKVAVSSKGGFPPIAFWCTATWYVVVTVGVTVTPAPPEVLDTPFVTSH
jgi:hypothetical protein